MKTRFKRTVSLWLSLVLLFSCVQLGVVSSASAAESGNELPPNGEYTVNFNILEDGKDTVSTANTYMKIPGSQGKLIVDDGVIWFEHEVTDDNYSKFEYLGYRPEGVPMAIISDTKLIDKTGYLEVASRDAENSSREILRYGITDITERQDIVMHINIPDIDYDHWYNAQLSIDTSGLSFPDGGGDSEEDPTPGVVTLEELNEFITVTEAVYDESVEGTDYGQYPVGSKEPLGLSISDTKADLAVVDDGDVEAYEKLYSELDTALQQFLALQWVADKSELEAILFDLNSFVETAKPIGHAQGTPGSANSAYIPGEYAPSPLAEIVDKVEQANAVLERPDASQEEVDDLVAVLPSMYEMMDDSRYIAHDPMKIYVLDTDQPTSTESDYVDEFDMNVTTVINSSNYDTWDEIRGNITMTIRPDDNKLYWPPAPPDGSYASPDDYEMAGMLEWAAANWNLLMSTGNNSVFQQSMKWSSVDKDSQWLGLAHLTYHVEGVKRSVYISFNRTIHEQLQALLSEAENYISRAVRADNADQTSFNMAKADLSAAIEQATPVVENLNATRPQILTADADLQADLDALKAVAKISSTTDDGESGNGTGGETPGDGRLEDGYYYIDYMVYKDGSNSSSIAMDYFVNPALLEVRGGNKTVSFTVTRSEEINGLKIGGSSGNVESRDRSKNTRVVSFTLSDLSEKLDGWVKIDWDEFNYHHEYDIQFLFKESTIEPAGSNPDVPLKDGDTGPPAGLVDEEDRKDSDEDPLEEEQTTEELPTDTGTDSGEATEADSVTFKDTETHWAGQQITRAVDLGLVTGYSDGSFRPEEKVTRAEIAVILSRALKLEGSGEATNFQDVSDIPEWAAVHIVLAVEAGLLSGYTDQTFRSNNPITRAELVVLIARAAGLELQEDAELQFTDAGDIPAWAHKEIAAAYAAGLIQGKENNRFDPNAPATRAEALTLALRLLDAMAAEQEQAASAAEGPEGTAAATEVQ